MAYQMAATVNLCRMAEDRIVKFCAQVGLRSISLVMIKCPPDRRRQGHMTS